MLWVAVLAFVGVVKLANTQGLEPCALIGLRVQLPPPTPT